MPEQKTFTIKKLIEELSKHPEETPIYLYIDEAEEFGDVESIELIKDPTKEDALPYAKGDKPEVKEPIILIKGWII